MTTLGSRICAGLLAYPLVAHRLAFASSRRMNVDLGWVVICLGMRGTSLIESSQWTPQMNFAAFVIVVCGTDSNNADRDEVHKRFPRLKGG